MLLREAIVRVFETTGREMSVAQVRSEINRLRLGSWKDVGTALADLTILGNSTSQYAAGAKFLTRVRRGV